MAAEKNFENKIKKWLQEQGIYPFGIEQQKITVPPIGYYEKRWGGGTHTKAGLPDMHIVVCGTAFEVELKAPDGKPSLLQILKLKQVNVSGGYGVLLYPKDFEQFKQFIFDQSALNTWFLANKEEQKCWEIKLKGE